MAEGSGAGAGAGGAVLCFSVFLKQNSPQAPHGGGELRWDVEEAALVCVSVDEASGLALRADPPRAERQAPSTFFSLSFVLLCAEKLG